MTPGNAVPQVRDHRPGDVFQINERHGRGGWVGAFVTATEIKSWGIQGFVYVMKTHDEHAEAYIRLKWDEMDHIGRAVLMPAAIAETQP